MKTPMAAVKAMQAASNAIRPDITLCTRANIVEKDGCTLVEIKVQRGTSRPYYLAEKGVRPAGVFVRQGAMTAPASESAILAMIKESANDVFDAERSLEQDLTFEEAQRFFSEYEVAFGEQQMRSLGFIDEFGTFTNTGLLFSDQCPITVKGAVFEGDTKSVFKDRFEFSGSILRQLKETLEFLNRYNATHSEIGSDMRRVDRRDYPENAIREALLNMFVHRDYSVPAPALVSVFDHRVEFVNFGGLVAGMSADDLMMGVSLQRNPHIAAIFYRLKLIEAYGTGIPKILESYASANSQPAFDVASNSFKTTLPSLLPSPQEGIETVSEYAAAPLFGIQESRILDYLNENGSISRTETEALLRITRSPAGELLSRMERDGYLDKIGSGKNTRYTRAR
ncbi:ATP-binding protein [Adlercreutzia sp. R25]|nr:ATP-binding protein [Adlercreutzia sp. R25]